MHEVRMRTLCLATLLAAPLALGAPVAAAQSEPATQSEPAANGDDRSVLASEYRQEGSGQTLEDFFTAAMDFSPRLRIAEERKNMGEARRRSANGQLLPQVSATASVTDNRQEVLDQVNEFEGERLAVQLRQVLFDWAAFSRRGRAYAEANQFEAEYYTELATVFADVAERYFAVLEAQDTLATVEAELRAVQNQFELTQRQNALQMVPLTDLYDVEARLATLEAEQLAASSEISIAREALRSATGLQVGELFELGEEAELVTPEGSVEQWSDRAQHDNPQISAREFALQAAEKRVGEQRGAYMPQVSLVALGQRSDVGFDNRPLDRTDTTYFGVDVTVPLFAGGSNRASVSEALSQESIARHELRQTQLEVDGEARMLYLRLQANKRRLEAAQKVVDAAELAVTSRQRAFELGNTTSLEVLEALRDRFQAERELQTRRYEHINLSLRLQRAVGELTAEDMLRVSGWLEPPGAEEPAP